MPPSLAAAVLAALVVSGPAPAPPAGRPGDGVIVKREGARLMRAARFYGKSCAPPAEVRPGQRVTILERQRGWARIAAPGAGACWLHESAWSDRTAGAAGGAAAATGQASQRDVELAARGFSEAEEARYRGERGELDAAFEALEAHLARGAEPAPEELERFVVEGGIRGGR
jgi:hypothetical protein